MTDRQPTLFSKAFTYTLLAVVGQVGCLTVVIVLGALVGGLWLDRHFGTRALFTVGLFLISVPVTVGLMLWIVRRATRRLNTPASQEESGGETGA